MISLRCRTESIDMMTVRVKYVIIDNIVGTEHDRRVVKIVYTICITIE